MNIQEILKNTDGVNVTLSVTPADLKEFALAVIEEFRASEARLECKKEEKIDTLMTQTQVAEYLGVSKPTLWRWKKEKYLVPTSYIGSRPMYSKVTLDEICKIGNNNRYG